MGKIYFKNWAVTSRGRPIRPSDIRLRVNRTVLKSVNHLVSALIPIRASIARENIVRFSREFYETILVGKFPSYEISEKCASYRSRIIDIQSFLLFHRT